jgi:hypothetical protein
VKKAPIACVILLAAIALLRVADTWCRFSQVFDEPFHIGAGLEWIERGTYRMEVQHPPLARIFDAALLSGHQLPPGSIRADQLLAAGNVVLNDGDYARNLMRARAGSLPFLLLAIVIVCAWAWRLGGASSAIVAVLLFSTLPPVLAHGGVATTDIAAAATTAAALFAFVVWLESRTWRSALLLTLAGSAALLSKFSTIPYCGLAMVLVVVWRHVILSRADGEGSQATHSEILRFAQDDVKQLLAVFAGIALLTWACYRFTVWPEPIFNLPPAALMNALAQTNDIRAQVLFHLLKLGPIPAPAFFFGLEHVGEHLAAGHASYLLGATSTRGWWSYFPVVLAVKTPLAFLIITIPATVSMLRRRSWQFAAPALCAIAILAVAIGARLNIGVRHILPIYAPLAICGGIELTRLWNVVRQRSVRALIVLLLVWNIASSALAHPDYLAWFNELAGAHPDAILVDSNLDWGQDLPRLREAIRENHITNLWLRYFGSADLSRYPLGAQLHVLPKAQRVRGWIAISRTILAGAYEGNDYAWLRREQPVAEVGKSMLLYYVR